MDRATQMEFLNKECTLYRLILNENSVFLLLLNVNSATGKQIADSLEKEQTNRLNFTEKEDYLFSFENINENGIKETDDNIDIIKSLYKEKWGDKYAYLIFKDGELMVSFNLDEKEVEEENVKIIGAFLNEHNVLLEMLKDKDLEIILYEFVLEMKDKISSLIFDEEDEILKKGNGEELQDEEEENFDKEFKLEELIAEEELGTKKKGKNHRKKEEDDENLEELENKEKRKKRRRRDDIDESRYMDEVTVFLAKLREAIELDRQSFENKKPAIEKLKLLPLIHKFLANVHNQKFFLQSGGLELLQEWIKKSADGTYPALNQISQMLDTLSCLNISLSNLKSCQVGGYVMELSKTMKESKPIQRKAKGLVEKWSRIVWDINTNYSDIDSENRMYEMIYQKGKRRRTEEESDDDSKENINGDQNLEKETKPESALKKEYDIYSHAKIPKKGLFDFTIKPVSNINESKVDDLVRMKYNPFNKRKGGKKEK